MSVERHVGFLLATALLALCGGGQGQAAVTFACTVTATGVNFGVYNPLSTTADTATGTYLVTCTASGNGSATVSGTLSLSSGLSGKFATRTLVSGANILNYNIYMTPTYQQILGDGTAGTYQESASGTVTSGQVYQVGGSFYGQIPAGQEVPPGGYSDTIVVTVAY
jgi:spore coat protein U-like protein